MLRARKKGLPTTTVLDLCLVIMISGFIGSRALHIFYEAWDYYKVNPQEILKIWQGGFVFYGGFLSAFVAFLFFIWKKKLNFWSWSDLFAPVIAFGYALGRVACFLNGCCFGKLCELSWAVEFQHIGLPEGHRHPTQLYAVFWELTVLLLLFFIERGPSKKISTYFKKKAGFLFCLWLSLHSLGRLLMEHYRDDLRGDLLAGQSISTWISYALLMTALACMIFIVRKRKN